MAYRKSKFRRQRKRFGRKRRATKLVNNALSPIPQRYITKMKYSETVSTTAAGTYAFNLNDLFDPNRTGVGHQPYGHDTLATLYNRYRVIACGYRITCNAQTAGNTVQMAVMPANELLAFTSVSEMRENPRSKYTLASGGGPAQIVSGKVYLPSLVGRSKAQYMADDRYQAVFGAGPQELAVLNIKTSNGADVDQAVNVQVLLEYTVECFDIKHLAQS